MVKGRSTQDGRPRIAWFVAPVLAALAAPTSGQEVRLTEAAERGTFNVGAARAGVTPSTDPAAGAILRFDYTIPPGAAAGVWAKRFPEGLKEGGVDLVRPSARAADPGRLRQVAVTLEIKGSAGVQRIPLELHHDWAPAEQDVDWKAIGTLSEVVVSVSRVGEGEPASGTIDLDVRFERLPLSQRLATYRAAKLGGVLLVGLVAALLAALAPRATAGPRPRGGLLRDALQGAGAVAIAGLAIGIYALELEGADGGRLAPPRLRGRGRGAGRVVEIRAHRPAPDARRGAPRRPRDRPARGLLQPAGDPPGAEGMVRPARAERDRRGRRGGPLPRRQRREGGLLGAAPGRDRRRPDRRHALRGRGARAAGIRRVDADARELPERRGAVRPPRGGRVPRAGGGPLRLQRGGGQRPRPGDEADPAPVGEGAPGAAGRGGRRDRRALDRGPGLGRGGRLLGGRCPACWPSWRPRSCRRRGSGPRGIS